ncbi:hypothetical protein OSB04_002239 [Centaurea solstitialis]|uniref:non-specific serine/threonine protein kinase n=1 Tax=Centaurea solstitialis TaxID=347529 RepID=A0AA38UB31_9ASTR|nr:hypothetical protein OSB04_002239 [Centaurea solstitialis]
MSPAIARQRNNIFVFLLIGFISFAGSNELQLLLNLKDSLAESNTGIFQSWRSSDPVCNFTGITCDDIGSFVREIDLSNQNLRGTFKWKSLENMTELVVLSLGDNPFDKTPFPNEALKLHKLYWLYMSNCSIEGEIPAGIGGLMELVNLEISDNYITGEIPNEISWLNKLWQLGLYNNNLSGKLRVRLRTLTKLEFFNASNNDLEGDLSEVRKLPHRTDSSRYVQEREDDTTPDASEQSLSREMGSNQLFGRISSSLSSLILRLFDLSHNRLVGAIPEPLYNGSFVGNPGLCNKKVKYLQPCPSRAKGRLIICFSNYSWNVKSFCGLSFTKDDIVDAIKKENMIGRGRSGEVYRVSLENGVDVAVKHIRNTHSLEFAAEEEILSSIRHDNVLVYEYLPNGNLSGLLHSSGVCGLDWKTRYEIAIGVAKALEYLHHDHVARPVIHRDVKPSNILLVENLKPRLADFGLAKVVQSDTQNGSTHVIVGTHGYMAPVVKGVDFYMITWIMANEIWHVDSTKYGYSYRLDEKSDVYSFEVVLMELVKGRKPSEDEFGEDNDIVRWVCSESQTEESVLRLVD